jgi:hypothetical protein
VPNGTTPGLRGSSRTFRVSSDGGQDTGTPVSDHYDDHFHFKGELDKVVFTLD